QSLFERTYGFATNEIGRAATPTSDGGYILAADVPAPTHQQFLVIKTDSTGAITWQNRYGITGSSRNDFPTAIVQTFDGGYAVLGYSQSTIGPANTRLRLLKLNSAGALVWQDELGTSG